MYPDYVYSYLHVQLVTEGLIKNTLQTKQTRIVVAYQLISDRSEIMQHSITTYQSCYSFYS